MANHASLFTEHVVTGLLGAAASQPANSHMTLEEPYTYVRDRLAAQGRQRPQFASQGEGGLRIARRADALGLHSDGRLVPGDRHAGGDKGHDV